MKHSFVLVLVVCCAALAAAQDSKPLYYQPAISADGTTIAFVHNDDIYTVPSTGGAARLIVSHEATDVYPSFSPDGKRIAFTSYRTGGGDVYVVNLDTGDLLRLTWSSSNDQVEAWHPDGSAVYFSNSGSGVPGSRFIYRVSLDATTPVPVVWENYEPMYNATISPDGSMIAFNTNHRVQQWWRTGPVVNDATNIWIKSTDPAQYDFRQFTTYEGKDTWPMWAPDGAGLYYVSNEGDRSAPRLPENIYFQPMDGDRRKVTSFTDGRITWPDIASQSGDIVFEHDFGIWLLPSGGEPAPVAISAIADENNNSTRYTTQSSGVQTFRLSPDNKKVAFLVRGELYVAPAEKGDDDPVPTAFRVTETAAREDNVAWDKDSNRVFFISSRDGNPELYVYDFISREEKRLTETEAAEATPLLSPDGKWLAYYRGMDQIRLINTEDMSDNLFQEGFFFSEVTFNSSNLAWSPDSAWLAYVDRDDNYFANIFAARISGEGEPVRITNLPNIGTGGPLWSNDGTFIIFTTRQYRADGQIMRVDLVPLEEEFEEDDFDELFEKPKEEKEEEKKEAEEQTAEAGEEDDTKENGEDEKKVVIETDGIHNRLNILAPWSNNSNAVFISPDDKTLLFANSNTGRTVLWSTSTDPSDNEPANQIITLSGLSNIQAAKDKNTLWLDNGPTIIRLPLKGGAPKPWPFKAEKEIDFHAEKLAAFREAWVLLRDNFYEEHMNEQDWDAVYQRFLPYVRGARTNLEFMTVGLMMLGDLNASHLGLFAGLSIGQTVPVGDLGLDFDPAALAQGQYKISNIVLDAAVAREKSDIAVGDYLLAINGEKLTADANLDRLLAQSIGKRVTLTYASSPDAEETKELKVKPTSSGFVNSQRYEEWVNANRAYVDRISGGRLGYLHISSMGFGNLVRFRLDLTAEAREKDGVVIDVRYNSGGHVAPFVLDVLQRRTTQIAQFRGKIFGSSANTAGNRLYDKPTVLVQNERSLSNAEMFAEGYRQLGLGKIVGSGSNGWVIWTWGRGLVNGSFLRLPRMKVTTLDGEDLDEAPREPDVKVIRPIGESHTGKDSQLDAAVKTLLEQIDN